MSCTGKGTICNMGAEITLLHLDMMILWGLAFYRYRADVADAADKVAEYLTGDAEVYANRKVF
jgi:aconitate hydratase